MYDAQRPIFVAHPSFQSTEQSYERESPTSSLTETLYSFFSMSSTDIQNISPDPY